MTISPPQAPALLAAADMADGDIAPAWPLAATVAVNPYLGQRGLTPAQAGLRLARASGAQVTQPRAELARRLDEGAITDDDLDAALAALPETPVAGRAALRAAADRPAPERRPLPTVADLVGAATGTDWPGIVDERIGHWAASHFDTGQAAWPAPRTDAFGGWRHFARHDRTPGILGLATLADLVRDLPGDADAAIVACCARLSVGPDAAPDVFLRYYHTLGGWAQLVRGADWQAGLGDRRANALRALLCIRLAWETALYEAHRAKVHESWEKALSAYRTPQRPDADMAIDLALQEAANRAAERRLAAHLSAPVATSRRSAPDLQAAFCIDVRSEVFRRHLETADPGLATLGFAGFFGLAVRHRAEASDLTEARAPVLLPTSLETCTALPSDEDASLRIRRRTVRAWGRFKTAAVSCFAFVDSAGPLHAGVLLRDGLGLGRSATPPPAPMLDLPFAARVDAAGRILRAMSLTRDFAPLVLIAGHGARVVNAPFASALQCGACGGHAGDVNARLLAELLNDDEVRAGLAGQGIVIPPTTRFVAGLHDTIGDDVTLFADDVPASHSGPLARLRKALARAGHLARTERAARLPRAESPDSLVRRGADWAETRPEWGLAGCAAFIAAPRHRTAGRDLGGRAFLHDYAWRDDTDFATLELILTAPVVVASWIALQYFGSTTAPDVFGSGNKLLHNVVGGLGVVEGNGGRLRTGLPWQSVHDGTAWAHDAVRLTVALEAPKAAISAILARNPDLRDLFDHGWLALYTLDESGRMDHRYDRGQWLKVIEDPAADRPAA